MAPFFSSNIGVTGSMRLSVLAIVRIIKFMKLAVAAPTTNLSDKQFT